MKIENSVLQQKVIEKDYNFILDKAYQIASSIVSSPQKGINVFDYEQREDLVQESVSHIYKNLIENKINPEKNVFNFIYTSCRNKIIENLRVTSRRKRIRYFEQYDETADEFKKIKTEEEHDTVRETMKVFEYNRNYIIFEPNDIEKNKRLFKKKLKEIKKNIDENNLTRKTFYMVI